jgi:hypothetical protein
MDSTLPALAPYTAYDAHPFTVAAILATMLLTPLYIFATYVYSRASARTGLILAIGWILLGGLMGWVCIAALPSKLDLSGSAIIPAVWILPSLALYFVRDWALSEPLSQRLLVGLQVFRAIGGVFLIEMVRGNIPGVFAYPAGLGDLLVSALALAALWSCRNTTTVTLGWIRVVGLVGMLDFMSSFFFGFGSTEGRWQIFAHDFDNKLILFPSGLIPLFLVPYAIFFYTLSWLNHRKHAQKTQDSSVLKV